MIFYYTTLNKFKSLSLKLGLNQDDMGTNRRHSIIDKDSTELVVKNLLKDYTNQKGYSLPEGTIDALEMKKSDRGKPYFPQLEEGGIFVESGFVEEPIHFNVSHSGDWWACILSDCPVGLDLEVFQFRKRYRELAKRFYTEEEYQYVMDNGAEAFLHIWVGKEAYVKLKGSGIAEGLKTFSVVENGMLSHNVIKYFPGGKRNDGHIKRKRIGEKLLVAYCTKSNKENCKIINF